MAQTGWCRGRSWLWWPLCGGSASGISASTRFGRGILLLGFLLAACTERDPIFVGGMAAAETTVTETTPVDAAGAIAAVRDVQDSRDQSWSDAADAGGLAVDLSPTDPGAGDGDGAADSTGSANEVSPPDAAAPLDVQEVADVPAFDGQVYDTPELPDSVVDAASADLPGDGAAADLAAACTLDAATWPGPPDTALLPGESTACQALGIAACVLVDSEWWVPWAPGKGPKTEPDWVNYVCFDAAGTAITSAVVHPSKGIDELAKKLPCSAAQLQKWQAAYQQPCWKMVPSSAMPVSLLTLLFDSKKLPAQVCSNIDGTRFALTAGCSEFVYTIQKQSKKLGPDPGDLFVGIYTYYWGFDGARWHVVATPASVAIFDAKYPVFKCKYSSFPFIDPATGGYWGAGVETFTDPKTGVLRMEAWLSMSESSGMPNDLAGWQQVLAAVKPKLYDNPCLNIGK